MLHYSIVLNIVLLEPEIPQNTGNVARTAACTGATLHLVKPFKFEINDKTLKRAGLDYWDKVKVKLWDSFSDLENAYINSNFYFIETGGKAHYTDIKFKENDFIVFGKETTGIDKALLQKNSDRVLSIPMRGNLRSLNLSNCVAIVLYEALRQIGF